MYPVHKEVQVVHSVHKQHFSRKYVEVIKYTKVSKCQNVVDSKPRKSEENVINYETKIDLHEMKQNQQN